MQGFPAHSYTDSVLSKYQIYEEGWLISPPILIKWLEMPRRTTQSNTSYHRHNTSWKKFQALD